MADTAQGELDTAAPELHTFVRRRTAADVTRLAWFVGLLLLGVVLATGLDETMAGVVRIPDAVAGLVISLVIVIYLALVVGAPIVLMLTRRFRTLLVGGLGIVLAATTFGVVRDAVPVRTVTLADGTTTAFTEGAGWPPTGALATYTAVAVIAGVELPRRWRHAVWVMLGVLVVMRVLTAQDPPLDVVLAIGTGGVVGAALLLAFGRTVRITSPAGVLAALRHAGLEVTDVAPLALDRGSWEHRATTPDGAMLVKVVGQESQQLDSLQRTYRRIRLRDVGDDTPYSSARRAVAVESLLSVYSADNGVRSPDVRAIAPLGGDDVLLAIDEVTGTTLRDLDDESLTDDVLRQCWAQVRGLRRARVAHRALELENFVLDAEGSVWLVDYAFGQPAADDTVLAGDVAELLAATYVRVGAARAVAAAVDVLGHDPLAEALPRLVPAALTRQTRADLKDVEAGTEPLVTELCRVTGVEKPEPAKLERLKPQYLVMGAMFAIAMYVLLPQLADFPTMLEAIAGADMRLVLAALVASALTYVGVALSLAGATPGRSSVGEYAAVAMSSSFVATFAPPGIGHTALNLRYLQKRGMGGPLAVSVLASKEAATFVVHLLLLAVIALWAGRSGALEDELERLPPAGVLIAIGGGVLLVAGLSLLVPRVRAVLVETVVPAVKHSVEAMGTVARNPVKITMLFGGVALLNLAYSACLYFSVAAVGGDASFAAVALVYLTAGSVASASPTPGGLGAVEAILLAALTGIGVLSPVALAGVFLYRLATFWLPILPGLAAFRWLTARGSI